MQVQLPPDVGPGMPFVVGLPDGTQVQVVCPPNVGPGGWIQVQVPSPASVEAPNSLPEAPNTLPQREDQEEGCTCLGICIFSVNIGAGFIIAIVGAAKISRGEGNEMTGEEDNDRGSPVPFWTLLPTGLGYMAIWLCCLCLPHILDCIERCRAAMQTVHGGGGG